MKIGQPAGRRGLPNRRPEASADSHVPLRERSVRISGENLVAGRLGLDLRLCAQGLILHEGARHPGEPAGFPFNR